MLQLMHLVAEVVVAVVVHPEVALVRLAERIMAEAVAAGRDKVV